MSKINQRGFVRTNNYDRTEEILWQIVGRNNWRAVACVEGWIYMYDKMPRKMKLVFGYKIEGYSNKEISDILGITERTVRYHVKKARDRVANLLL